MDRKADRRVAIFLARWPVQSQEANCAVLLAEAGYQVDFFFADAVSYVDLAQLAGTKGIKLYDLTLSFAARFSHTRIMLRKALSALRRLVPGFRAKQEWLPLEVAAGRAAKWMAGKSYRCLIGVEKSGLLLAGQVGVTRQIPFMYYSLELYTEDYRRLHRPNDQEYQLLHSAECRYHGQAVATIIQDPDRAAVLLKDNGLAMDVATIFYVPVSVLGRPRRDRSWYLHETLGLPRDKKIILYFGQISENRYVFDLAKVAQGFPDDWRLVMHGDEWDGAVGKIKAIDQENKVAISLNMVAPDDIPKVVGSADVGLAFYSPLTQNERLTAFSSEKTALYLQCGVPFVAFDYPGYRKLAQEDRCGVAIPDLERLPAAIASILASHEEYSARALQAFSRHFDFKREFGRVIEKIDSM